jgi:hypothetical protein
VVVDGIPAVLIAFDTLAQPEPLANLGVFPSLVRRNPEGDRPAEDLRGLVPDIRSAARFQLVMIPWRSVETIASVDDSTIAAGWERVCSACRRSVTFTDEPLESWLTSLFSKRNFRRPFARGRQRRSNASKTAR